MIDLSRGLVSTGLVIFVEALLTVFSSVVEHTTEVFLKFNTYTVITMRSDTKTNLALVSV
nr:MAG TPA: hypothetical protein [Caudoviricetes sp.]